MYLVHIYATEHYVDRFGKTIWCKLWTPTFDTLDNAQKFIDYHKNEFGHRAALYKRNGDRWELISDTRYF